MGPSRGWWAGNSSSELKDISVWVNERNLPAIRLYRRCGFEFDGRSQPLPPHPGEIERRMVLLLGDPYPR